MIASSDSLVKEDNGYSHICRNMEVNQKNCLKRKVSVSPSTFKFGAFDKNMLSDNFFHIVGKYLKFYNMFSATPILLDPSNNRFRISKSAKIRFSYFVVPSIIIYTAVLILQSIQLYGKRGKNFYFTCVYSLCAMNCCIVVSILVWYPEDIVANVNAILDILNDIQRRYIPRYNPNKSHQSRLMDKFAISLQFFTIITASLSCVHCILFPNTSIYIINEFPDHIRKTRIARVFMFIYWTVIIQTVWVSITLLLICGTAYIIYFIPLATTEMYCSTNFELVSLQYFNYQTTPTYRRPRTVRKLYRRLEIAHKRILGFCSYILIPIQTMAIQLILFCVYVLFNHWHTLHKTAALQFFNWSFFVATAWSSVLQVSGMIHMRSQRTLMSWKVKNWGSRWENMLMSRFRRSCQPLTIGFGKTFVIKRLTVLKFFKALIRGVFRIMLMTKGR